MKKDILCSICRKPLVPYQLDKRMGFCETPCHIYRCGWCGGVIGISYTYYRAPSFWDWLVPQNIMKWVIHSPTASCSSCGRRYPSKFNVVKYLFWEAKVLWWKIRKSLKNRISRYQTESLSSA